MNHLSFLADLWVSGQRGDGKENVRGMKRKGKCEGKCE